MTDELELQKRALKYHAEPKPGKVGIQVTKPTDTQDDLSLAYSPGVAAPVRAIAEDPELAYKYTAKGNLVLIVSDGSAILGLGNRGALASKPVMEGKAVLFKLYADVDVFDIELDADNPEDFIETVVRISSGFGGINLEDIAAPQCFDIQRELSHRLDIPVFHDDQYGTAIIICAGLLNALELGNKHISKAKIVCLGAGAAGIASMKLLMTLGVRRKNIMMVDRKGVIHTERDDLNVHKQRFAIDTNKRTLLDACTDADVFIGVSGANLLTAEMLEAMAPNPIIFALSNPDPEITPELAFATRDDIIMATGRSDHPNQVNNVLGFPYIFRGTLDVNATTINREMMKAAVEALRQLTHSPVPKSVLKAYGLKSLEFGPEYIIPKPNDPRLIDVVPAAISEAAIKSGVARVIPEKYSHILKKHSA